MAFALSGAAFVPSARADIYQCKRPDGSIHITNTGSGRGCKLVARERRTKARRAGTDVIAAAKESAYARSEAGRPVGSPGLYLDLIEEAALLYELPATFLQAVMRVESAFHPTVVSNDGAMGLMQLMPKTAQSMGVTDPFDPRQNILGGARYLRILANRFDGDLVRTVAAYNAGEGAVERHGGIPPYDETQRYVRRVLNHYYQYRTDAAQ